MKKANELKQIIAEKVTGKITPDHGPGGHFYIFNSGKRQASVTTKMSILDKPHLKRWAIRKAIEWLEVDDRWKYLEIKELRENYMIGAYNAHIDVRDDAGDVGSSAHDAIESYLKDWLDKDEKPKSIKDFFPHVDGKIIADMRAVAGARGFEALAEKHNIIPLASEILVGDPRFGAGTLDFLCLWNNRLTLVDFKTSNQISDSYAMQVAAYRYFWKYMTGINIKDCRIIHLSKDSDKFTVYKVLNVVEAYKAFRAVATIYDWKAKIIKDVKKKII